MSNTKNKTTANKDIIASPEPKTAAKKKSTSKKTLPDDIIGSNVPMTAPKEPAKTATKRKVTVAIYSTKNVVWEGVGKVEKGYNIIPKAEADKWLTRNHVRLATPEEVAREYGA